MNHWLDPVIKNYDYYFGKCKNPVVWEVGSRDGHDGVELARRIYSGKDEWFWDRATIVAFEPNPAQAEIIRNNYPEIEVFEIAASNKKGEAPFMLYSGDEGAVGSSSLRLDWKRGDLVGKKITVQTDRLENLIGSQMIDVMKIDVEGYSLEVIEGLATKLGQVKVFHTETEKWTDSNIKMKAFMMSHGFILVDETEQYGGMPDQVWVRA